MPLKKQISAFIVPCLICIIIIILCSFASPALQAKKCYKVKTLCDTVPEPDTADKIFSKVEIEASFPGGEDVWRRFLEKNLDGSVATKKKAPVGVYTVIIQFVVDKEGKVSDIRPLTNQGFGMEEEVMRILRKAPRWKPASQDGRNVKAYRKQPVTFMVEEEKKKKKDGQKGF